MSEQLTNYIRSFRKRANLTQGELAFLLGCKSGTKVSRYERRLRDPNLYSALACQAVFRVPVDELFPDIHAKVESNVIKRAHELNAAINTREVPSRFVQHKQAFLRDLIAGTPMQNRSELWENQKNKRFYLP